MESSYKSVSCLSVAFTSANVRTNFHILKTKCAKYFNYFRGLRVKPAMTGCFRDCGSSPQWQKGLGCSRREHTWLSSTLSVLY